MAKAVIARPPAGFTQMELMLALALGSGLCLVAAQYYQHAVSVSLAHEYLQQRAEQIVVLRQTVGGALQRALDRLPTCRTHIVSDAQSADTLVPCPTWLIDSAGVPDISRVTDGLAAGSIQLDGHAVTVSGADEEVGVTQYFSGVNVTTGQSALYRRRAREEGGFQAAEELVTGLSGLKISGCYPDSAGTWHCVALDTWHGFPGVSAHGHELISLRVCAQHAPPPAVVGSVLGPALESLDAVTCVVLLRPMTATISQMDNSAAGAAP